MLVRKMANEKLEKRDVKVLTLFHLMDNLRVLKKQGYFYYSEDVTSVSGACITMGKDKKLLYLPPEWNAKQIEKRNITSIRIIFKHIITNEFKYLFMKEEKFEDELQTVMWMDQDFTSGFTGRGRVTVIKDMPMVFQEILKRCEMIIVPGKFYKLNLFEFRETMQKSLFSLLYQHHYCQVQEGKIEIKKDKAEEKSFAWAGEFRPCSCEDKSKSYLEVVIYHREFEEGEYSSDENLSRVWREEITDVYVAWCRESLSEAGPVDEKKIPLKKLRAEEEIAAYMETFHYLDWALANII